MHSTALYCTESLTLILNLPFSHSDWCLAYGVLDAKESQKLLDGMKYRKDKKSNTPTKTKKEK